MISYIMCISEGRYVNCVHIHDNSEDYDLRLFPFTREGRDYTPSAYREHFTGALKEIGRYFRAKIKETDNA